MSRAKPSSGDPSPARNQKTIGEWIAWIATEDHCEWANKYVAGFRTPLGVLFIGAFCSLLCGLFVAPQGFVLLAAITAVIGVGLAWPLVAIRGVRARVVFEARRGREGRVSTAKLIITNRWPWPVWGLTVDDPLLAGEGGTALSLARISGWSTATFKFSLTPEQRGVYPKTAVHLSSGFPFGLYQASRRVDVPRSLIVWPQTFTLPPLGVDANRPNWRGAVSEARAGTDGARLGVRDHRVGDSLRDIHWANSARFDRLIVSERESATAEDVAVVVDLDRPAHEASESESTLEWRLRIAASICESFVANQGQVDLWLGGKRRTAGQAPGDLAQLMDEVARCRPNEAPNARRPAGKAPSGAAIAIEAEATRIVLKRSGVGSGIRRQKARRSWIEVDSLGDVPRQVLLGWRSGAQRGRRVG